MIANSENNAKWHVVLDMTMEERRQVHVLAAQHGKTISMVVKEALLDTIKKEIVDIQSVSPIVREW